MTDNVEVLPITDVKHYVISKDAEGKEVRTEVNEEQVTKKDFSEVI